MMNIPNTAPRFFFNRRQVSDCMELFSFNYFTLRFFHSYLPKLPKTTGNHRIENMKGLADRKIFHQGLLLKKVGNFGNKKIF